MVRLFGQVYPCSPKQVECFYFSIGAKRTKMDGDRKNFSDRGKEKAPSQSQSRDFTKKQYQRNDAKSREIDKKRVPLEGGKNQIEQRRGEYTDKAAYRAKYYNSRVSHLDKRHGDLSGGGKEKAPSQPHSRDFKQQKQQNDAKSVLGKKRVSLRGGMIQLSDEDLLYAQARKEEHRRSLAAAGELLFDLETGGKIPAHWRAQLDYKYEESSNQQPKE